jgi:ubiquinone/menaquinone biosynthesis C-methylase UbiE
MDQRFDQARASFFDNLAEQWDEMGPAPAADEVESFLGKLNIISGDVILDVGTGTGLLIPYIMKYAPAKVIAMDLSKKMLQRLTDKYQNCYMAKLETLCNDVRAIKLNDGAINVAICNGVFPHFSNKTKALTELRRILQSGGRLVIHHFAGRNRINSIHSRMTHELIRHDHLESMDELVALIIRLGFIVQKTVDNDQEFFLLAAKA